MNPAIDNRQAAQLLHQYGYATREQILSVWDRITPEWSLPDLLAAAGILSPEVRDQLVQHLAQPAPATMAGAPPETPIAASAKKPTPSGERSGVSGHPPADASQSLLMRNETSEQESPMKSGASVYSRHEASPTAASDWTAAQSASPDKGPHTNLGGHGTGSNTGGSASASASASGRTKPEGAWMDYLRAARDGQASDLHLSVGKPPHWRRHGVLEPFREEILTKETSETGLRALLGEESFARLEAQGDLETVLDLEGLGRYRMAFIKHRSGIDATARLIPTRIFGFEELGLPAACRGLTHWAQGLVLVTGPAGCGKSCTLATLVDMVNRERPDHIITLEDPIEILFRNDECQITQRQMGVHTQSPEAALRAALREDPDILVVSELRDLETIQLAVSAAETGHLVFATLNTINASRTIYRLIDSFPPEEQGVIRNMVSESLRGVISQQLLPLKDGSGVVPAFEVLLVNSAVSNMIRKDEAHQLGTAMMTGKSSGMVLLDDSLKYLVESGRVDGREAWKRAINPKDFEKYLD